MYVRPTCSSNCMCGTFSHNFGKDMACGCASASHLQCITIHLFCYILHVTVKINFSYDPPKWILLHFRMFLSFHDSRDRDSKDSETGECLRRSPLVTRYNRKDGWFMSRGAMRRNEIRHYNVVCVTFMTVYELHSVSKC